MFALHYVSMTASLVLSGLYFNTGTGIDQLSMHTGAISETEQLLLLIDYIPFVLFLSKCQLWKKFVDNRCCNHWKADLSYNRFPKQTTIKNTNFMQSIYRDTIHIMFSFSLTKHTACFWVVYDKLNSKLTGSYIAFSTLSKFFIQHVFIHHPHSYCTSTLLLFLFLYI